MEMALPLLLAAAAALGGVLGVRNGRAFFRGDNRRIARWYFDRSLPFSVRNLAFAQTQFGYAALGLAASIVAGIFAAESRVAPFVILAGSAVFVVGLVIGVAREIRPPERLKPDWLKEEEAARRGRRTASA